jgi:hypothetical protein
MGLYLSLGIANKIFINKKDIPKGDLENQFDKNFKLDLYDIEEDESRIILTLKRKMLEKNAVDLLEEIKQKARSGSESYYDRSKESLKDKKYKEIMEVANRGYAYNFQYMEGYVANNRVSYLFKRGVDAYCDLISIERDGKTIFECYYDIFSLFRNSVIDSLQNELKYALVVTLIG